MQQILVYADSLSWGIIPLTRNRFDFHERWPGVMEHTLRNAGRDVRVIEDCLNGRRTMYEDPIKPGRNGLIGLAQRIEVNSPLALVILMLGTNDFQRNHAHNAADAGRGMEALIDAVRNAPVEPGMPVPPILVVVPPAIMQPQGDIAAKFEGGAEKCKGLAEAYRQLCDIKGCYFFDAATITSASRVDGVHLDLDQHHLLGLALADFVSEKM